MTSRCRHFAHSLRLVELHPKLVVESTCTECGQRVMASEDAFLVRSKKGPNQ